jgi:hypothetical protein
LIFIEQLNVEPAEVQILLTLFFVVVAVLELFCSIYRTYWYPVDFKYSIDSAWKDDDEYHIDRIGPAPVIHPVRTTSTAIINAGRNFFRRGISQNLGMLVY